MTFPKKTNLYDLITCEVPFKAKSVLLSRKYLGHLRGFEPLEKMLKYSLIVFVFLLMMKHLKQVDTFVIF